MTLSLFDALKDALYPRVCPVCGAFSGGFCPACLAGLAGGGVMDGGKAYAAFLYEGAARDMILDLKHHNRPDMARPIGAEMAARMPGAFRAAEIVVPVPLHRNRKRARGYNQSALLARSVGRALGLPVTDALERVRDTAPQQDLRANERAANTRGAFAARLPNAARGKAALLIDDVYTTGATADAAAEALKQAGAREVWVLAACLAGGK